MIDELAKVHESQCVAGVGLVLLNEQFDADLPGTRESSALY